MNLFRIITCTFLVSCSVFIFTGCGNGNTPVSTTSVTVKDGILDGTYSSSSSGLVFPVTAAITSNNLVGFDIGNGVNFYGKLNSDNTLTGNEDVSSTAIVSMSADEVKNGQITLTITQGAYALSTGDTFTFSYTNLYQRPSSLSQLVGTWSGNNPLSMSSMDWNITFQPDGSFTGTTSGIDISGNASLIDATTNEYAISMTLSHPSINYAVLGNYTGFAYFSDTSAMNDTLHIFIRGSGSNTNLGALVLQ